MSSAHHVDRPLLAAIAQGYLARIELAEDDVEAAEKSARSALQTLESHGLTDRPAAGSVHVAVGAVLARLGETQEAGDALVRGLARLRRHGEVLEIADALLVYAPVRRALESLTSARGLVEEARLLLADCSDPGAVAPRPGRGSAEAGHRPGALPLVQHDSLAHEVDLPEAEGLLARRGGCPRTRIGGALAS